MVAVAVPVALVPAASSYVSLLVVALFLGLAGSSFAVGVTYVSRWTTPAGQGAALGVYGLGNAGHSAAVFLGPLLAAAVGPPAVFRISAVLLVAWGIAFAVLARDAPARAPAGSLASALRVLRTE
jgi:NNP family nitrate/nitrite transporter-like MFS transporter